MRKPPDKNWFYGCCEACRKLGVAFGLAKLKVTKHYVCDKYGVNRMVVQCDTCGDYTIHILERRGPDVQESA